MTQGEETIVLGAVIALSASLLTAVVTAFLDWRRRVGERKYAEVRAQNDRVRDWHLRRLDQTRIQLIAYLEALFDIAVGRADETTLRVLVGLTPEHITAADPQLIGDIDAVVALMGAATGVFNKLTPPLTSVASFRNRDAFDDDDRLRVANALELVRTALQEQERRVLEGGEPRRLTAAEVESVSDPGRLDRAIFRLM